MVTAEVRFSRRDLVGLKYPMEYVGIDWETYEDISEELGESRPLHVTFYKGTLTIMPVTELHEMLISLLDKFVAFAGMFLQSNVVPTGGATLRSESKLIGVEPDLSYFVSKTGLHRVKNYVENEIRLPPDIVVEIDISHRSDDKFFIYSELGIAEFWRYVDKELKIFILRDDGTYSEGARSAQLPVLTSQILTNFLNRGEEEEQFKILNDFQNWLQKQ